MVISGMEKRIPTFDITVGIVLIVIRDSVMVEFTLKIRRPDGMDQAAVGMPVCSVTVIHIRMAVNEGDQQHPQAGPPQHQHSEQAILAALISRHQMNSITAGPLQQSPDHSTTLRNRRAFEMTDTELNVIAALANMGLSNNPTNGYRTPAATGTPTRL